jgi:hypothetical protein
MIAPLQRWVGLKAATARSRPRSYGFSIVGPASQPTSATPSMSLLNVQAAWK